ncbi:MAG: aldo/keto reductase [Bdellovibrionales bacterium]|nr:aldo/keto reductase [Bdellovibrionales bacterium]
MKYWTIPNREHTQNQAVQIPKLGFGTYGLLRQTAVSAVEEALKTGFRHIDTAQIYQNEKEVGEGIKLSKVPREEIFLVTKVWRDSLQPEKVIQTTKESLLRLSVDYVDLLLIHWPNSEVPLEETLSAMESLVEEGKTRFIGVSNFPSVTLKEAKNICPLIITNQVEYHTLLSQDKILKTLRELGMLLTAYSPLARGAALQLQQVRHIAEKHKKHPEQIVLKWLVDQENVAAIVKSQNSKRIQINFDIFHFELDPEDRKTLHALSRNQRRLIHPPFAPQWDRID